MACFGIGNGGQDHQSDQPITIHIKPRKMAEAGYEMVQHYAWKNVRTQLMEIYERTLSHRF